MRCFAGGGLNKALREFHKGFAGTGDVVKCAVCVDAETHDACAGFKLPGNAVVVAPHHHRDRGTGNGDEFGIDFTCRSRDVVHHALLVTENRIGFGESRDKDVRGPVKPARFIVRGVGGVAA